MIRRVAFGKAIVAGAAGAFAWELVARILISLGVTFFDLVYVLGTMIAGRTNTLKWWLIGMYPSNPIVLGRLMAVASDDELVTFLF